MERRLPACNVERFASVMIARLKEINLIRLYQIYKSVFFGKPARPGAGQHIFQRLRFSNTVKWIPEDGFNQIESPQSYFTIRVHPVSKVFNEFRLENSGTSEPMILRQSSALSEAAPRFELFSYRT